MAVLPNTIEALDELDRYDAILCDVWGVVHNGVDAYPDAAAALRRARQRGCAVVLITNSPRPHGGVEAQMRSIGVPDEAWDRIVTSGDVTRDLIREGPRKVLHIGPERELAIYDGIDVELVEMGEAAGVVCTGLYNDEEETPDDYLALLARLRSRDLPMICANPDIVVERGDRIIWCAGALARQYEQMGGRTFVSGKPHRPIYEVALHAAEAVLGRAVDIPKTLAVGDGMLTDIKGAADFGLDVLYISGGVHSRDYGDPQKPDPERFAAFLAGYGYAPVATMPKLR